MNTNFLFKLVLAGVTLAHLIIGGVAYIPGFPVNSIAEIFYKASIELSAQTVHVIHMFGAYMLTIGILGFFALLDPVKNKAIVNGVIIVLLLRVLQRVMLANQAQEIFHIPLGWYWGQTIFFLIIALFLLFLSPKTKEG